MTRRAFLESAAALAVTAAVFGGLEVAPWSLIGDAHAQGPAKAPTAEELLAPGPLPDQVLGDAKAPVTIIEYASMTCSHCAAFHTTTYPQMKQRYVDTGKVRYILREFPLDPLAAGAFMLARCAGEGKYYPLVETLFKEQKNWAFVQNPIPPLFAIAKQAGFNEQTFEKCLSDQKLLDSVEAVRKQGAEKFGVTSTPTFFINGKVVRGAMTADELDKQLQPYL